MRRVFSGLLAISMVALSLTQLTACKLQAQESTTTPAITDQRLLPPLTLEQAEQQLKETGSTFVDTVEKASRLTGYPVAVPAFIPKGFTPRVIVNSSSFNIYKIGFSLPFTQTTRTVEFPYDVQQTFAQAQGVSIANEPFFMITQSRNNIRAVGDKEPVDIGGHPGKKSVVPAQGKSPVRLGLSWSDGTRQYVMMGTLTGPLDEAALIKIAASMSAP